MKNIPPGSTLKLKPSIKNKRRFQYPQFNVVYLHYNAIHCISLAICQPINNYSEYELSTFYLNI
ncbi:CLUMA_CG017599, isoform A [Clunio marinus]|uniref:CLUMA_CG017599, isoform A n=1 Tax=Clunio marinus TaxID=568069 RepID=A0A1J1IY89_9DIPT|nr:CLUMA_CG017599, isoform A [Clunio marinus]